MDDAARRSEPLSIGTRQLPWQRQVAVPLPADAGFAPHEHWAWARIIRGDDADMSLFPVGDDARCAAAQNAAVADAGGLQPKEAADWPDHRALSPAFLRTVLFCEPWASARARPLVRLRHAALNAMDWSGETLSGGLVLHACQFNGPLNCVGLRVGRLLSLAGSHMSEGLIADGMRVDGNLFCRAGFSSNGEIRLIGARVGGDISFATATLDGDLRADGVVLEGHVFCTEEFAANGTVSLVGARVNGQVAFINAVLKGAIQADGVEISGDCFFRDTSIEASVQMPGARIGQDFQLSGSLINGAINLTGAEIVGELSLAQGSTTEPTWGPSASLNLRNAKAGALAGGLNAFRRGAKDFVSCDLSGFTYNRIGGLGAGGIGSTLASARGRDLRRWLKRCRASDHFDPAPYRVLSKALDEVGRKDRAADVRNALGNYELMAPGTPLLQRIMLALSWLFIGYGERNHRAFAWFAALVIAAAAVGYWQDLTWLPAGTPDGWRDTQAWLDWVGFAFGNAIPLLTFDEAHKTFLVDRFCGERVADVCTNNVPTGVTAVFYAAKALGFIILSYLAAGLSGLAQRRD